MEIKHFLKLFVILVSSLFWSATAVGNNKADHPCEELTPEERNSMAAGWIDDLEKCGLTVTLISNRRQIQVLESILENPGNRTEGEINRVNKQYEELLEKTELTALNAISAFSSSYSFSPVYFIWDYDIPALWLRPDSNIFVGPDLENCTNTQLEASCDEVFLLYRGRVDASRGSGIEAWIVRNREYNYLCRPFPYYVGRNNNWLINALLSIFNPDFYQERDLNRVAEMFQERFENFRSSRVYIESVLVD